jgi:photosystem I P700 chlorophyll a apoprotein A1
MSQLYPSFQKVSTIFQWSLGRIFRFLTFKGGLNPVTGGLWLTDIAHHHLALSVYLFSLVICTVLIGVLVIV